MAKVQESIDTPPLGLIEQFEVVRLYAGPINSIISAVLEILEIMAHICRQIELAALRTRVEKNPLTALNCFVSDIPPIDFSVACRELMNSLL